MNRKDFPRLHQFTKEDATKVIMGILSKAHMYKGYRVDADNIRFVSEALYDEMMLDNHKMGMPNITMYEIGYAIKKSIMDNPEFFFSVTSLYGVIKDYCKGEGHQAYQDAVKLTKAMEAQRLADSAAPRLLDNYSQQLIKRK